jgi:hypothetical protein
VNPFLPPVLARDYLFALLRSFHSIKRAGAAWGRARALGVVWGKIEAKRKQPKLLYANTLWTFQVSKCTLISEFWIKNCLG